MAQHSNSSGSGNWLVRGFMGILSITATAVVSTLVQRYFATPAWTPASAPSAAQPSLPAEPMSDAYLSSPSPQTDSTDSLETNPPQANQSEAGWATNAGRSDSSPIQVETQPVPDALSPVETAGSSSTSASEPAASESSSGATLREKLDSALKDKWNKQ